MTLAQLSAGNNISISPVSLENSCGIRTNDGGFDYASGNPLLNIEPALLGPLVDYGDQIQYSAIKPEDFLPAINAVIRRARAEVEKILERLEQTNACELTFDNSIQSLIDAEQTVINTSELMLDFKTRNGSDEATEEFKKVQESSTKFLNFMNNDSRIYKLYKAYSESTDFKSMGGAKKRYIELKLINMKNSGAELSEANKAKYNELCIQLNQAVIDFSENRRLARADILISEDDLKELSPELQKSIKAETDQAKNELRNLLREKSHLDPEAEVNRRIPRSKYLVGASNRNSFAQFMQDSTNQKLREELFTKASNLCSKGSDRGILAGISTNEKPLDNTENIREIVRLRQEIARLVGHKSHADLVTTERMASSVENAKTFIEEIIKAAMPRAKADYQELVEFQKEIGYVNLENDSSKILPWDQAYLAKRLYEKRYAIDTNEIKRYFEFEHTYNEMLKIISELFGIKFNEIKEADKLCPEEKFYEVLDAKSGEKLGNFRFDPFKRSGIKLGGAWHRGLRARSLDGRNCPRLPISNLVTNFSEPSGDSPTLLTLREVETMFHEFGHGLHNLLSKVNLAPLAGTRVVKDFVEVPSQLMERFIYNPTVLKRLSKHYQSGKSMPDDMIQKIIKSKNFRACSDHLLRSSLLSLLDMEIYSAKENEAEPVDSIYQNIRDRYRIDERSILDGFSINYFFHHIFESSYAGGYYSYRWSEALADDAFSKFTEAGLINDQGEMNPQVGLEWREKVLSRGNSKDANLLIEDFLGRKANPKALLESKA